MALAEAQQPQTRNQPSKSVQAQTGACGNSSGLLPGAPRSWSEMGGFRGLGFRAASLLIVAGVSSPPSALFEMQDFI